MNSDQILEIVNELTSIHNAIIKNEMFSAGSQLSWLQQRLVDKMMLKEKEEKQLISIQGDINE